MTDANTTKDIDLKRTVNMWRVVKNNLGMMFEEIILCQNTNLAELCRRCEDAVYATSLVIPCLGANRCCYKILCNMECLAKFNVCLLSLASYLRRRGKIKPYCIMCIDAEVQKCDTKGFGFMNFFCPDCSFHLLDSNYAYCAYQRVLHLFGVLFERQNLDLSLNTLNNITAMVSQTAELMENIPITSDEMACRVSQA